MRRILVRFNRSHVYIIDPTEEKLEQAEQLKLAMVKVLYCHANVLSMCLYLFM